MPGGLSVHKRALVCTPRRISLSLPREKEGEDKESPRAIPIHTSVRCDALPACVGELAQKYFVRRFLLV